MKALPLSKLVESLTPGRDVVVVTADDRHTAQTIRTIKKMPKDLVISLAGIDDIDKTAVFRNAIISVERKLLPPLPDDEYFVTDLQGLTVETIAGQVIGVLVDVFTTGSSDIYVVRDGPREYLIPAIKDVITKINLEDRTMVISPMEGLLDLP
jgi:16S rRNA processing protein RimM